MTTSNTWREFLQQHLKTPSDFQRVARILDVSEVTLRRWLESKTTRPHIKHLRDLLNAFPQEREELRHLLAQDFPEIVPQNEEERHENALSLPVTLYEQVIQLLSKCSSRERFEAIRTLIFPALLSQLDRDNKGILVSIAECFVAHDSRVHCLIERARQGTFPWSSQFEDRIIFFGSESLAGYAVHSRKLSVVRSREEGHRLYPVRWTEHEESAVAAPIQCEGKTAGCLIVSSTQSYYFQEAHSRLIQQYANLLLLLFEPHLFYHPDQITMHGMPSSDEQNEFINVVGLRINCLLDHHPTMGIAEAQYFALQEIVEKLQRQ